MSLLSCLYLNGDCMPTPEGDSCCAKKMSVCDEGGRCWESRHDENEQYSVIDDEKGGLIDIRSYLDR